MDGEPSRRAPAGTLRGTETILLVEDEEQVRGLVAHDPAHAAAITCSRRRTAARRSSSASSTPATIHLLLTDVVMPRMSGRQLAERLRARAARDEGALHVRLHRRRIVRHGVLDRGVAFLQKPFTPDTLTRKVREVLDAPSPQAAPQVESSVPPDG